MLEIFHYLVRGKCSLWTLNHLLFSGQICLKEGVRSGNFCLGHPKESEFENGIVTKKSRKMFNNS